MKSRCLIGTAGWSLPRDAQPAFPAAGSHLERYASRFPVVEINSSFHRPHKRAIWQRWADSVPEDFRFSAKLPKTVTHEKRLAGAEGDLDAFLEQSSALGAKLACLLVQLPPSLAFDNEVADVFFETLRRKWPGQVAIEPRHASWFMPVADALLARNRVARVLADPVRFPEASAPGGWDGFVYLRLHGSPRVYYSSYDAAIIDSLARRIATESKAGRNVWCIFDNTASGAAAHNALALEAALAREAA